MTLIEILVVLGMMAGIIALTALAPIHDFSLLEPRKDRETLMDALLFARGRAISGMCSADDCARGAPHGVFVDDSSIVIFEGPSYEERNRDADYAFPRASDATLEGDHEFLFFSRGGALARSIHEETRPRYRITVSGEGRIEASSLEP
jgi:hypothetical protein